MPDPYDVANAIRMMKLHQALGYGKNAPELQQGPSLPAEQGSPMVGPNMNPYPQMQPQPPSSADILKQKIAQAPKIEEYKPSTGRKVGGILNSIFRADPSGKSYSQIADAPFRKQQDIYARDVGIAQATSDIDTAQATSKAKIGETEARTKKEQADIGKIEAEAERAKKQGNLYEKRAEHVGDPKDKTYVPEPHRLKLRDGTIVPTAMLHKETGQYTDPNTNTIIDPATVEEATPINVPKPERIQPVYQDLIAAREKEIAQKEGKERPLTYAERLAVARQVPTTQQGEVKIGESRTARDDLREDRSYQFHTKEFDTVEKPIADVSSRLQNLQEALSQATPQADTIIAPQLLTIMAGGSGSGVRMSEAEISRIMGGRSHWEALRAAAQAWNPNNAEANKITPDQRKQIRSLANALNQKINAKRELVTKARRKLTESSDISGHRKSGLELKERLAAIDDGSLQFVNGKFYKLNRDSGKYTEEKE